MIQKFDNRQDKADQTRPETGPTTKNFPMVCVGGSAGGLDAYLRLLQNLTPGMRVAIVIFNHCCPPILEQAIQGEAALAGGRRGFSLSTGSVRGWRQGQARQIQGRIFAVVACFKQLVAGHGRPHELLAKAPLVVERQFQTIAAQHQGRVQGGQEGIDLTVAPGGLE